MKFQAYLNVVGKFTGGYQKKDGTHVETYNMSTVSPDGHATEVGVPQEVFDRIEINKAYLFSGNAGSSKYGQFWKIDGIIEELKTK